MYDAAVNLVGDISANYPNLYGFLLLLAALMGFVMCGYVLVLLLRVKVFHSLSPNDFNTGAAIIALIAGACLLSLSYSTYLVSGSLLNAGHGSLFGPEAIQGSGLSPKKLLGMFAEQTARMVGFVIAFWGYVGVYSSRMPGSNESAWPGVIRVCLGAILILARDFMNLFGSMGDMLFG